MIASDLNVQSVELVAAALGDLCDELVLVGGCAVSLLIDAPTALPPRVTYDVDLIAVVAALRDYHALEARFAQRGFKRDMSPEAPICRWRIGGIQVDLMPTDESVLGFSNRWYPEAVASAGLASLPSGNAINLIAAPAFLATKFEAFRTRGKADLLTSHDFEDMINVVEGRQTIVEEVDTASAVMRDYLANGFADVIAMPNFNSILPGLVAFDELHEQRVKVVKQRLSAMAGILRT